MTLALANFYTQETKTGQESIIVQPLNPPAVPEALVSRLEHVPVLLFANPRIPTFLAESK